MKHYILFFILYIFGFFSLKAQQKTCVETQVSVKSADSQIYLYDATVDKYGNILISKESFFSNGQFSYSQQINNVYNSKNLLVSTTKYLNNKEINVSQLEYNDNGNVKELSGQTEILNNKISENVSQKIFYDQYKNINSKELNTVNTSGVLTKKEIFDKNDKLVKRETFNYSSTTNKLLDKNVQDLIGNVIFNTVFEYENENKTKELEYVNNGLVATTINTYNNNLLVSKSKLNQKNELDYKIEYEYDTKGRLFKQTFSNSQSVLSSVENTYDNLGNITLEKQFDKNNKQIKETTRTFKCI